jgi:hypothetical protein
MNLDEEQLKRRVEERQLALTEKVKRLKERVEQLKQMTDVRSVTKERPAIMLAGSVLVGFLVKKFMSGRNRNYPDGAYRMDAGRGFSANSGRFRGRLWEPIIAAVTTVATRTAIGLVNDMLHKRQETGRSRENSQKKF